MRIAPWNSELTYAAALLELEQVHRLDQARLLREAGALPSCATPLGRLYVPARGGARGAGTRDAALSAWREACREEIRAAGEDGVDLHPWLAFLLDSAFDRWPCGSALVEASLRLDRSHAGRLDLARARIGEEDPAGAIHILNGLLREHPHGTTRCDVLEALALAFESTGGARASLPWYAAALGEPRSDLTIAVSLLAAALRCGDAPGVELATRRLAPIDLSVAGTRSRFLRALRLARARAQREIRGAGAAEMILRLASTGRGACAEVARALLRGRT